MNYKKCEVSADGFVIPDFDFDSSDAVLPVSAFTPYEFDTTDHFVNLLESIDTNDIQLISKCLQLFRASIIDNCDNLPPILFQDYNVPEFLMDIIDPFKYPSILYLSLCAAIAWTGAQSDDSEIFNDEDFIYFLIETSVTALSDPKFTGDKKIGNAAIGLLRNLINNSDNIRVSFIKMDGIKLFSSLFLEIKPSEENVRKYILWVLQNALNVSSEPPFELLKDTELVLRSTFESQMKGVDRSEIRLAIAYVKCGPKFAISLMKNVNFEVASIYFVDASPDTQVSILDLFETLLFYPDSEVARIATEKIKWSDFMTKIPILYDKHLNKKFISIASHFFSENFKPILSTPIVATLIHIFKTGQYSVRLKVIDCLSILIQTNSLSALDAIIFSNVISHIIDFLEEKNSRILMFTLQMILFIIRLSQNDYNQQSLIIHQLDESEFGPIIEEFCASEHNQEVDELADLLQSEYEAFSNSFDEIQMNPQKKQSNQFEGFYYHREEEDIFIENDMQDPPIHYEISDMHLDPNFPVFPDFDDEEDLNDKNFDDEENEQRMPRGPINYEELSKVHQKPNFNPFFKMNKKNQNNENLSDSNFNEIPNNPINYEKLSNAHQKPDFSAFFCLDKESNNNNNNDENSNENGENVNANEIPSIQINYDELSKIHQTPNPQSFLSFSDATTIGKPDTLITSEMIRNYIQNPNFNTASLFNFNSNEKSSDENEEAEDSNNFNDNESNKSNEILYNTARNNNNNAGGRRVIIQEPNFHDISLFNDNEGEDENEDDKYPNNADNDDDDNEEDIWYDVDD